MLDNAIIETLAGTDGIRRLLVTLPPRHGKSEICCKWLPAWFVCSRPNKRVILCGYGADFAASWGRKSRSLVEQHGSLFGVSLATDSRAADRWGLVGRDGGLQTAGVGGPITGHGADLLIIDDPVKNRLAISTPIPTPSGWSTMGALKKGDLVFDELGKPALVTAVSPVTVPERCYELTFDDGSTIIASYDHPWLTKSITPRHEAVRTTEQLFETQKAAGRTNHSVLVPGPLELATCKLPTPPYMLGAWLGDGDSSAPRITVGIKDSLEIAEAIRSEGVRVDIAGPYRANPNVAVLVLRLSPKGSHNAPLKALYKNKHIPPVYLRSSYEQRLALLQGMLDTDGTAASDGTVVFAVKNRQLAEGTAELMRTLAWKPRIKAYVRDHGSVYCVSGTPPRGQIAFRLTRKQKRLHGNATRRSRQGRRYIVSIRQVSPVPTRCISVANQSRLYLAGTGFTPTHNSEEASSELYRDRVWEWFLSTAYTRLEPGGAVILIQTRWNLDDLAGRIISQAAEPWRVLNLPAIDPEGRALWPERYPVSELERIKQNLGSYWWSSLYQQTPVPDGGLIFKREWFSVVPDLPAECRRAVRYWDKAATEGGGDYSAGVLLTVHDGVWYIADVVRGQWSSAVRRRIQEQTAAIDQQRFRDYTIWEEQEPGSSGKETAEFTRRALAGYEVRVDRVTGDKVTRARPIAAQAEAGNVRLVGGPWVRDFLDELCTFPHGRHDDQVDGSSGGFAKLAIRRGLMVGQVKQPV